MSDIFISYASEDRARAKVLAGALERQGWSVWWDRKIPPGKRFAQVIEEAIDEAKCIIVLWSEESVKSEWVQNEAAEGARRKILVPALLDDVKIPFEFRRLQAARLVDWEGRSPHSEFDTLLEAVCAILGQPKTMKPGLGKLKSLSPRKPKADFLQSSGTETRKGVRASEQIEVIPTSEAAMPTNLFKRLPPSFRSPFELDAEYILIPGGRYKYRRKTEKEVSNIYFAKYPVTNKLYRRFIRHLEGKERELLKILPKGEFVSRMIEFASGIEDFGEYLGRRPNSWPEKLRSDYDTDKDFNGEDQPVVGVSWFDASAYCYWLSLLEAAGENLSYDNARGLYRLPSEIEWEWAAGGGVRKYPWSPEKGGFSHKLANYGKNVKTTTPVGSYPDGATPEGLMDMAGNVWEWMENFYDKYENHRSLRGGSWFYDANYLRCALRYYLRPVDRDDDDGFRVVRSQ